jgi:hypothetical protein
LVDSSHEAHHGESPCQGRANYNTIVAAGGWTTFSAIIRCAAVDPEDPRRGYEEAMQRFAESSKLPPQTMALSLEQYLERTQKTA